MQAGEFPKINKRAIQNKRGGETCAGLNRCSVISDVLAFWTFNILVSLLTF